MDLSLGFLFGSTDLCFCLCASTMASDPITSWEIDEETVEIVSDFILGGSKITADGDRSHEIKKDTYSWEGKV